MVIYWSGCILSILLSVFSGRLLKNTKKLLSINIRSIVSSFPLALIAGLRYNVGTDYFSYIYIYYLIGKGQSTRYEPLYTLVNRVLFYIGAPSYILMLIFSFSFCYLVFRNIFEESPEPGISIFLVVGTTFFFIFMNGMRQMLGCAVCSYSLKYIRKKRFISFLVCIIIATGFHYSCALFLLTFFFDKIKINKTKSVILLMIIYMFSDPLVDVIVVIVSKIDYYKYYLSYANSKLQIWLYVNIAVFLFCTIFGDFDDEKYRTYYICQFLIVCLSIFNGKIVLLSRIMWVFCLPQLILIPETISKINNKKERLLIEVILVILYFSYSTYSASIRGANQVIPYQTILFR